MGFGNGANDEGHEEEDSLIEQYLSVTLTLIFDTCTDFYLGLL